MIQADITLPLLTDRQREVLEMIHAFRRDNEYSPSTREIQRRFGFASQTAAMSHMKALTRKGVIVDTPGASRSVRLTSLGRALIANGEAAQ